MTDDDMNLTLLPHAFYAHIMKLNLYALLLCTLSSLALAANNPENNDIDFVDSPLDENLKHPNWFKDSSGYLSDDLEEALAANKKGIIVYFGQNRCPYCDQFLKKNIGSADIQHYLRQNFDLIHIDIWSNLDIVDTDGKTYTERELSTHYKTNFTPSLIFYNRFGKPIFRLRGYYPPYKFRAALKFVAEDFYRTESFRAYLARATTGMFFLQAGLNERDFFIDPPYDLKAILNKDKKPLMVSFEHGDCHACDLLHTSPLNKPETLDALNKINSVQLNMWTDTPIVTPDGKHTTSKKWAEKLNLFYAPTLLFFDSNGKEIIRIESVVGFYRLLGVLNYINQGGYLTESNFQSWSLKQRKTK